MQCWLAYCVCLGRSVLVTLACWSSSLVYVDSLFVCVWGHPIIAAFLFIFHPDFCCTYWMSLALYCAAFICSYSLFVRLYMQQDVHHSAVTRWENCLVLQGGRLCDIHCTEPWSSAKACRHSKSHRKHGFRGEAYGDLLWFVYAAWLFTSPVTRVSTTMREAITFCSSAQEFTICKASSCMRAVALHMNGSVCFPSASTFLRRICGVFLFLRVVVSVVHRLVHATCYPLSSATYHSAIVSFSSFQYSQAGLRTLCVAYRIVPEQLWSEWNQRFQAARVQMEHREQAIERVSCEIGVLLCAVLPITWSIVLYFYVAAIVCVRFIKWVNACSRHQRENREQAIERVSCEIGMYVFFFIAFPFPNVALLLLLDCCVPLFMVLAYCVFHLS